MSVRVTIEATVWSDPRFDVLAGFLGVDKPAAIGRMAAVWGACTLRGAYSLPVVLLATLLQCATDDVARFLELSELGEAQEDGSVRIRGTKGRVEWLTKKKTAGASGGAAARGKRKHSGSTRVAQAKHSPSTPEQTGSTRVALAKHSGSTPVPSDSDSDSDSFGESASALSCARARVEPSGTGWEGQAPEQHRPSTRAAQAKHPSPERWTAATAATHTEQVCELADRHAVAEVLWARQHQLRRDVDPLAPELKCRPTPGGQLDAIKTALGRENFTPADLWRALDVLHGEAKGKREAGDPDPLYWLDGNKNWSLRVIDRALSQTPETARAHALGGGRKAGSRGRDPTRTGIWVEDCFALADALERQADEDDRRKAEGGQR